MNILPTLSHPLSSRLIKKVVESYPDIPLKTVYELGIIKKLSAVLEYAFNRSAGNDHSLNTPSYFSLFPYC